jgi:hypothetical protein
MAASISTGMAQADFPSNVGQWIREHHLYVLMIPECGPHAAKAAF